MNAKPDAPTPSLEWRQEDLSDPHAVPDKARRVQSMFAAIAKSYDLNNRLHSMGMDQLWRRKTVKLCKVRPTDKVLDVACGTGDLSLAFAAAGPAAVLGVDFTHPMVQIATQKHRAMRKPSPGGPGAPGGCPMLFLDGDAMRLPLPDASVDIVSIAFGIRNVAAPAVAIGEFRRVLRPGGRLAILEFSLPRNAILRGLYNFYFKHIMPHTATLISGDRSGAYKYLPRSVDTFLDRGQLVGLMKQSGFEDVTIHPMTFGIALTYLGRVP